MTDKEFKENRVIGYGIIPCLILSIITDSIISEWVNCTSEMAFGLLILAIILFGIWCTVWILIVRMCFKIRHPHLPQTNIRRSFIEGTKHEFDCECGKKIIVWTNNYAKGNTGKGSCECGAEIYIN